MPILFKQLVFQHLHTGLIHFHCMYLTVSNSDLYLFNKEKDRQVEISFSGNQHYATSAVDWA